jgi:hypothetical protein
MANYYARLASKTITSPAPSTAQATWLLAKLPVANHPSDDRNGFEIYDVTISWSARIDPAKDVQGSCKNCQSIAYAGISAPKGAKDLARVIETTPMSTKWANYTYRTTVVPNSVYAPVYVALGWNGTGSAIDLDCVTVNIVPIVK